jgi:cytochrome c peroxidase
MELMEKLDKKFVADSKFGLAIRVFWDGGVGDLDFVPLAPIENPVEMDEKIGVILEKLRKTSYYPSQFKKAFGTEEINTQRFLKALSQYMLTLVSADSKYDKVMRKKQGQFLQRMNWRAKVFLNKNAPLAIVVFCLRINPTVIMA